LGGPFFLFFWSEEFVANQSFRPQSAWNVVNKLMRHLRNLLTKISNCYFDVQVAKEARKIVGFN
jgi:hypothetical protein